MIQGNAGARRQDEPKPGPEKKKAVKNLAVGFCGWRPLWIKASSWSGEHSLPKNITQGCCGSHFWLHLHCMSGSGNPFTSLLHHFFLHPPTTGADQWSFIARRPRTATELVTSAPKLASKLLLAFSPTSGACSQPSRKKSSQEKMPNLGPLKNDAWNAGVWNVVRIFTVLCHSSESQVLLNTAN